jgi:hypothetical protein
MAAYHLAVDLEEEPTIIHIDLTEGLRIPSSAVPPASDAGGELYPCQLLAPFLPDQEPSRPLPTNLANGNFSCTNNPTFNHVTLFYLTFLRAFKT